MTKYEYYVSTPGLDALVTKLKSERDQLARALIECSGPSGDGMDYYNSIELAQRILGEIE